MKWFDDIKIRNKLFFAFGILVLVMISFAVFAVVEIVNIGNNNNELINMYQTQQIHIADAISDFHNMRFANLSRGYLVETDNAVNMVSKILADYETSAASFMENITGFFEIVQSDSRLTESEKRQRLVLVSGIFESFDHYAEIIKVLQTSVETTNRQEVISRYEETIPYGVDLNEKLQDLRDLVFSTTRKKAWEVVDNTDHTINLLVLITVIFIFIAAFALFFIVNNINKPIINLEEAVIEIANGNLSCPIRSERMDEIGILSNRIGDMVGKISEHNKLLMIMDNLDSMICVSDLDYNFIYMNKRLADCFGLNRNECIGQKCYKATRNLDRPCVFCQLYKIIEQKDSFPSSDFEYVWDDVTKMWLGGTDSIIRWVDGSTVHFQAIRDVSQKKHQEELLQEALEEAKAASMAKSSFLANMSHEIRTPMNAILGITEIQLQDESLPLKNREALDKIYHSGELLLNIINDILDLSKIEAGKLELIPGKYEVASLINDTVTLNMMRIGSKPLEFVLSVDEDIPSTLFGDELRIKQILNNLLSNSIKYTKEGVVKLLASVETNGAGNDSGVMLVFRVADTGQGMTQEQVSKLFDEYSRFNMEANRTTEGTGLGMSITRNLLKLMNGEISVESEVGKGSVFTVRFPQGDTGSGVIGRDLALSLEKFQANGEKQMKRAQIVFEPMPYGRILVVDDVESNLYVATGLMAPYGLAVETVSSGFEAIDKIKTGSIYDIVFMDHMMPRMDGIETTQKIRELGYKPPIVALTANAVVGQSDIFLANGFDGFISKPIDVRQLNSMLKKFVRDKQPPEVIEAAQVAAQAAAQAAAQVAAQETAQINPRLIEIFASDARKAIEVLETIRGKDGSYDGEAVRLYTINVHGMKSALANVGETELSALAAKLELAGREKNTAAMSAETPAFLGQLRLFVEKIAPAGKNSGETADGSYLREKLLAIKEACAVFDKKTAKNAIGELRQKTWPRAAEDALAAMADNLLNGDFDEVVRGAGEIENNL